jgi:hypothetical protein
MKKVIMTLVIAFSVVFLCNVKVGFTQEGQGVQKRLDYLESRISEITTVQEDNTSTIDSLKGLKDRVTLGFGLRTQFSTTEDAAGTKNDRVSAGRSWNKDFNVTNMRLYTGAKITDQISATFNTEITNNNTHQDSIRLLDAFAEYTWSDKHHIRFGRHLPASDRYNLDGPYYQNAYDFPGTAVAGGGISSYAFKDTGRVEGISYWGQLDGGKFKYQFSAAEGAEGAGNNQDPDHLMYTGRLTFCLWEPEPGYYNSSAFYGAKDVMTIGLVGVHQSDGAGTANKPTDYTAWNIDFLLEKTYDWGTIDVEAGYFNYTNHGTSNGGTGNPNTGYAWTAGLSYLFPEKMNLLWIEGRLQPITRYIYYDPSDADTTTQSYADKWESGFNYIIQPYNAKVSLMYAYEHIGPAGTEAGWNEDRSSVMLGMQFQH